MIKMYVINLSNGVVEINSKICYECCGSMIYVSADFNIDFSV